MTTMTAAPADLQEFLVDLHGRLEGHATRSETEAFLRLWSHSPDASIMAAVGGHHIGYEQVANLLMWVSAQVTFDTYVPHMLIVQAHGDLAFSVELEEYTNRAAEQQMTLRATQVYRREEGAWRILHRHAEELTPVADLSGRRFVGR
ncbi:YybH family protein [Agromyces aurantiacus]|uniref:YybH family protein n=1 Tax=Agromyces aurantiacus TaxID=165814 RepID=A0ABV9RA04_9MICO|nr:nuclear transport factor 2 family protein [Agromyces aurantiacus]MBM7504682.1 ketosteroid isomerase-like protein [Agromyces aurantiacus]